MKEGKKTALGITGCVIGFIAMVAAFFSPQIAKAIDPPSKSLEENVVEFAVKLKNAAEAKLSGEDYPPDSQDKKPSSALFPAIIGLGMIGSGFGVASVIRGEKRTLSGTAIALGITVAVVQWSLLIAGAIIFCVLVLAVITALGGELPSP